MITRTPSAIASALGLVLAAPGAAQSGVGATGEPFVGPIAPAPEATVPAIERTPRGQPASVDPLTANTPEEESSGVHWFTRTAGALAFVIALIVGLRYTTTKLASRAGGIRNQLGAAGRAPQGILYVVARYPVARNQTLVLLQLHNRLILTSQSSSGFQTIAELNDPSEVAEILAKADDAKGTSAAARFKQTMSELENDPSMLDPDRPDPRAQRASTIVESKPAPAANATVKQYLRRLREAAE